MRVVAHGVHSSPGAGLFATPACLYSMAARGRIGPMPDAMVSRRSVSADERCLPEILERWNRYCGPTDRCAPSRGSATRPVLARWVQVGHERYQTRTP